VPVGPDSHNAGTATGSWSCLAYLSPARLEGAACGLQTPYCRVRSACGPRVAETSAARVAQMLGRAIKAGTAQINPLGNFYWGQPSVLSPPARLAALPAHLVRRGGSGVACMPKPSPQVPERMGTITNLPSCHATGDTRRCQCSPHPHPVAVGPEHSSTLQP
jgi:hypothetical protein